VVSRLSFSKNVFTYLAGQTVNELLPIGSGDLTRVYLSKRLSVQPTGRWFSAVALERTSDLLFLVLGAFLSAFLFFPKTVAVISWFSLLLVAGALLFFRMLINPKKLDRFLQRFSFLSAVHPGGFMRVQRFFLDFSESLPFFGRSLLTSTAFLTASAWCLDIMGQTFLLGGLGYSLPFEQVFAIATVAWILGTFSFLPGGLGAREAAFAYFANALGVPYVAAFSMALLYRGLTYLNLISFGILFTCLGNRSVLSSLLGKTERDTDSSGAPRTKK
ncbi:MAG TPA: lysylphosphatidylglycerol synthase transmembrane domain-containing protein, partial [Candidatus Norongarragalinales archaeon]|nr:lysylphosphatidylglycerol synthase transmembrane domain-containing protein [Candidatus Norongarragalinales archaeon]